MLSRSAYASPNHFIRPKEHRLRNRHTDYLRRFEIDHEFKFGRLLHKKIRRLLRLGGGNNGQQDSCEQLESNFFLLSFSRGCLAIGPPLGADFHPSLQHSITPIFPSSHSSTPLLHHSNFLFCDRVTVGIARLVAKIRVHRPAPKNSLPQHAGFFHHARGSFVIDVADSPDAEDVFLL